MSLHVIISLIAFVSYGGILTLILGHGIRNNKPGKLFFLYIACMLLMQMAYFMISVAISSQNAFFWYSLTVPITAGQTIVYFYFTRSFLELDRLKRLVNVLILTWFLGITLISLLNPSTIFTHIYQDPATGLFVPEVTIMQALLLSPMLVLWGISVFKLGKGYRTSHSSSRRIRIQYLILATIVVWLGMFANASSSLRPYPIDVFSNILAAFIIAYAILRHQLLDIHIVVRRGLVVTIPALVLGTGYFLAIFFITRLFDFWDETDSLFVSLVIAIIVVAVVTPLRDRAQHWIDQLFFRGTYDSRLMLQRLSQNASKILDFSELTHIILDDILKTMHVQWVAFPLEHDGGFEPVVQEGLDTLNKFSLSKTHPALLHLSAPGTVITMDTLDEMLKENALTREQFDEFHHIGVELLLPLKAREKLVGVLSLGKKESNQSYSQDDVSILMALANQVAVAIDNARLHEELQQELQERKKIERERETLITDLKAKNDELERFTYTVSHDLKAPLITIRGFLGYLEEDVLKGDMDRMKSDMSRIVDATDKMQNLLGELLELSRIGRMMNPPKLVPFGNVVKEAINLVRGNIEAHGVKVEIAPGLPDVYGDYPRLVEVVQNLVDNACKFMGEQPEPRVEIGQQKTDEDGHPIFYVRDNGIGIEPQYQDQIFELFHKLDAHTEGTGVGLALVKRILEVHGGRIWVESDGIGMGTCFYFTVSEKE